MECIVEINNKLKEIEDIEVHDTFSADKCYFKKNRFEFMVCVCNFITGREYITHIYNRPTKKWMPIHNSNDIDELIKYIKKI